MLLIVILVLAVPGKSQQPCPCTKYTVSLDTCSYGSLQICWSEEGSSTPQWYSVCSSSSMLNDDAAAAVAAVVCRQLGFNRGNRCMFG